MRKPFDESPNCGQVTEPVTHEARVGKYRSCCIRAQQKTSFSFIIHCSSWERPKEGWWEGARWTSYADSSSSLTSNKSVDCHLCLLNALGLVSNSTSLIITMQWNFCSSLMLNAVYSSKYQMSVPKIQYYLWHHIALYTCPSKLFPCFHLHICPSFSHGFYLQ